MEETLNERSLRVMVANYGADRVVEWVALGMKVEEERRYALGRMPTRGEPTCRTCRFYLHPGDVTPEPLPHGWGWCQRYPPTLIERVGSLVPVSPSAWCGEYQAR